MFALKSWREKQESPLRAGFFIEAEREWNRESH